MYPILFGVVFGAALFGGATIHRFEHDAERDFSAKVEGEHKKIRVSAHLGIESLFAVIPSINVEASEFTCVSLPFHAELGRSTYGKVRHLRFQLTHFTLHNLPVASMTADIRNSRFDFAYAVAHHHFRISKSGVGPLTVVLNLADVKSFAQKKFPMLHDFQITSANGRLDLAGTGTLGAFTMKFDISGVPSVQDGVKLTLDQPVVVLNGKTMDDEKARQFLKPFTPIVDLDRDLGAQGGIQLATVRLTSDTLVGIGTVRIPERKVDLGGIKTGAGSVEQSR